MADRATHEPTAESAFVHAGVKSDELTGAMLTPIVQSVAFEQISVERYQEKGYTYSRSANPTVTAFEKKVAALEGASFPAVSHGTGMAAMNCLMASLLEVGDHVIITKCSYGGTNRAARVLWGRRLGVEVEFVDFTNLAEVEAAIVPGRTRLVLSESPCNPTLELADLAGISAICRKKEAEVPPSASGNAPELLEEGAGPERRFLKSRIVHVADTTLAPPPVLKGLQFGVDALLISLTKYYCGHNMHLGGALVTSDKRLYELFRFNQNVLGSIMTPITAYSMLQSAKTLHLRVLRQSENAAKIAEYLENHPKVLWVRYPGLKSHPQREVASRQHLFGIHGGMVSFEVKGGADAGRRVMNACCYPWTLAENLGAVESIMTCPRVFTHANMTAEARASAGITDGMIRLSVGIEGAQDLIDALEKALAAA